MAINLTKYELNIFYYKIHQKALPIETTHPCFIGAQKEC